MAGPGAIPPSPAWAFIEAEAAALSGVQPSVAIIHQPKAAPDLPAQRYKYGGNYCCVKGCHNNSYKHVPQGIKFHHFPKNEERRLEWAKAINRRQARGELWMPSTMAAVICSVHFVGGKSNDPESPGYIPTVFPTHTVHRPILIGNSAREERLKNRESAKESKEQEDKPQESSQSESLGEVNLRQQNRDVFLEGLMSEFKENLHHGNHDLVLSACDALTCKSTLSFNCHQLAMAAHSPFMSEILSDLSHIEDVKIIVVGAEANSLKDLFEAMYDPFSENQYELLRRLGLWSDLVPWPDADSKEIFDFIDINGSESGDEKSDKSSTPDNVESPEVSDVLVVKSQKQDKDVVAPPVPKKAKEDPICRVCSKKIADSDAANVKPASMPGYFRDTDKNDDDDYSGGDEEGGGGEEDNFSGEEEGSQGEEEEDKMDSAETSSAPSTKVSLKFSSKEFAAIGGKLKDSQGRIISLASLFGDRATPMEEDKTKAEPTDSKEDLKRILLAPPKNQSSVQLSDNAPKKKVVVIKALPGTQLPLRSLMMKLKRRVDTKNEGTPVKNETLAVCSRCTNVVGENHQCQINSLNLTKIRKATPDRISFNIKDEPVSEFFSSMLPLLLDGKPLIDFSICSHCEMIKPISAVKSESFNHDCQSKSAPKQKGTKSFQCEECGKQYAKINDLKRHIEAEHKQGHHMCELCGKVLKTELRLRSHVKVVHEASREKTIPCETCGQLFRTQGILRIHRMQHTGERPRQCEICGKGFIQVQCCKKHIKSAHGIVVPKGENIKEFFKAYFEKHGRPTNQSDNNQEPANDIKEESSSSTMTLTDMSVSQQDQGETHSDAFMDWQTF